MASIIQTAKGYRAQVYVKGNRDSATFHTRREAASWASARETELREQGAKEPGERHTLEAALTRYRNEVSTTKRGSGCSAVMRRPSAYTELLRLELGEREIHVGPVQVTVVFQTANDVRRLQDRQCAIG